MATGFSLRRPDALWWLLCVVVILASLAGCRRLPPPSVVWITVDTLRADRLGCYGYFRDTSPAIDRLAEGAVLFENAVTPMSTTLPAHVSMMTSTYPARHGILGNLRFFKQPLDGAAGLQTFAQLLAEAGYKTAAFVSAAPLKRRTGIAAGFQEFDQPRGASRPAVVPTVRALSWLAENPNGPFFLWVHYWDPHDPYRPPEEFTDRFSPTDPELTHYLNEGGYVGRSNWDVAHFNSRYDDEVRYTDGQIGRLLDALRQRSDYQRLTIVLTSDHGEGLGQRKWLDHGRVYSGQLYVPLIVKLPGGAAGERRSSPVSTVDIVPTLVEALDLPISAAARGQFQGRDLFSVGRERRILSQRTERKRPWDAGSKLALTGERWKFVHAPEGADELYDLTVDRWEQTNLLSDHPELAATLRHELLEARAGVSAGTALEAVGEIPPEVRKELEALGYVD